MSPLRFSLLTGWLVASMGCRSPGQGGKEASVEGLAEGAVDADGDGIPAGEDCNDEAADVGPGLAELCNGIDDDCDGLIDEEVAGTWFADADGDGFGDPAAMVEACEAPSGHVPNASDCDDTSPEKFPGNIETCDGLDNDCDAVVDEDLGTEWWLDNDGDGFGDPDAVVVSCSQPDLYVDNGDDCNDDSERDFPGADERCDERDNDCDTEVDEGLLTTFYRDLDADGWGDPAEPTESCALPAGYSASAGDCDDGSSAVNPAATEVCNGIDDDCDTDVDDADSSLDSTTGSTFYADSDGDTYGDPSVSLDACQVPGGYVSNRSDCDDGDGSVNPAATEICFNGIDDDCSGAEDDGGSCYDVEFTSDATDVNLWEEAGFPGSAVTVYVTVASGVTIDASDPSIPAMSTDGFASGSTIYIENLGTIHGRGGDGACAYGGNGEDGGDAIEVTVDVELDTSVGGVYGGGGGGGAGDDPTGGGGGAGNGVGCNGGGNAVGGIGGHGPQRYSSNAGGDGANYNGAYGYGGTWASPGNAGSGGSGGSGGDGGCLGGQGGAGGGWGGGGGGGSACSSSRSPGDGGEAGWAVRVLSGSITITGGNDTTHVKGWVN